MLFCGCFRCDFDFVYILFFFTFFICFRIFVPRACVVSFHRRAFSIVIHQIYVSQEFLFSFRFFVVARATKLRMNFATFVRRWHWCSNLPPEHEANISANERKAKWNFYFERCQSITHLLRFCVPILFIFTSLCFSSSSTADKKHKKNAKLFSVWCDLKRTLRTNAMAAATTPTERVSESHFICFVSFHIFGHKSSKLNEDEWQESHCKIRANTNNAYTDTQMYACICKISKRKYFVCRKDWRWHSTWQPTKNEAQRSKRFSHSALGDDFFLWPGKCSGKKKRMKTNWISFEIENAQRTSNNKSDYVSEAK